MSASVKFTDATSFQAYIRDYAPQLLSKLFHGFPSKGLFTPHEGVKGQLVLTEMRLTKLVQTWSKTFDPKADAIDFKPRVLSVVPVKADLQIYPQEFETTYLGRARRPGFQPDDLPFEGFILDKVMQQIQSEIEEAVFQAALDSPTAGDPLTKQFDGFLEIISDAITDTTLTPATTAAHTAENALENAMKVHQSLSAAAKGVQTIMLCSYNFAMLLAQNLMELKKFTQYEPYNGTEAIRMPFGNCMVVPCVGMGDSSRLICTTSDNLHYGYDLDDDASNIRVEWNHRSLDFMVDFKLGVEIGILHSDILAVNDLS